MKKAISTLCLTQQAMCLIVVEGHLNTSCTNVDDYVHA